MSYETSVVYFPPPHHQLLTSWSVFCGVQLTEEVKLKLANLTFSCFVIWRNTSLSLLRNITQTERTQIVTSKVWEYDCLDAHDGHFQHILQLSVQHIHCYCFHYNLLVTGAQGLSATLYKRLQPCVCVCVYLQILWPKARLMWYTDLLPSTLYWAAQLPLQPNSIVTEFSFFSYCTADVPIQRIVHEWDWILSTADYCQFFLIVAPSSQDEYLLCNKVLYFEFLDVVVMWDDWHSFPYTFLYRASVEHQ